MKKTNCEAEAGVMEEAKRLFKLDAELGRKYLQREDSIPCWADVPAHTQATYVRLAAKRLGFPLPAELEVA
jgi:hypothetical protein